MTDAKTTLTSREEAPPAAPAPAHERPRRFNPEWGLFVALFLLPAAAVVYMSFHAGGFFAGTPAFVAFLIAQALVLRITQADEPLEGAGRWLGAAIAFLCAFALWIVVSAIWSDSVGRALFEFDRVLLYLLALVVIGSLGRTHGRGQWLMGGFAAGAFVVSGAAFLTRALPDHFPTEPGFQKSRLDYPLTYANALGMIAALGMILCFAFATRGRGSRVARVLGAAALPLFGATMLLTFSRGGMIAAGIGLIAYSLLGRPRGFLAGALAAGPATAIAIAAAYRADLLATDKPTSPAATAQGHDLFRTVLICVALAAVLRVVGLALDSRLAHVQLPPERRRPTMIAAWVGGAFLTLVVLLALGIPGKVANQYDAFVNNEVSTGATQANRLSVLDNGFRLKFWDASRDQFADAPLHGTGAGTWSNTWYEQRPTDFNATDGHSLYLETLSELGIVGFILLVGFLGILLVRSALLARGPGRPVYAAVFAVLLAWCAHAGVDWDWENPALTIIPIGLGAFVLARPKGLGARTPVLGSTGRIVAAICVLITAVTPVLISLSQNRLDNSIRALHDGRWEQAADDAQSSISMLSLRPEPYEVVGWARLELGRPAGAVQAMQRAVDRDPESWEPHYLLGVAQASAGEDPRAALATAHRLNPQQKLVTDAQKRLSTTDPDLLARLAERVRQQAIGSGELSINKV